MTEPGFPLRIIFDDGEVQEIASPAALMDAFGTIDSTDPGNRIWIRDEHDRTVRLRIRGGIVEVFEV